MTQIKKFLAFQELLSHKEMELISQREAVWKFVDTEHDAKKTEEYLVQVRKSALDLNEILRTLRDPQNVSEDFRSEAESLCQRCRELESYSRDMDKSLSDDLAKQQRAEDKKGSIDVVRNGGIFVGIVGVFIAADNSGVGNHALSVNQAAGMGAVAGALILLHKSVKRAFSIVGKAMCSAPKEIKGSGKAYHLGETIKENAVAAKNSFDRAATKISVRISKTKADVKTIGAEISKTASKAKRMIARIKRGHTPKP